MDIQVYTADNSAKFAGLKAGFNYVILSTQGKFDVESQPSAKIGESARHVVAVSSIEKIEANADATPVDETVPTKPAFSIPPIKQVAKQAEQPATAADKK